MGRVRLGLYGHGGPTATQLVEDADESLFKSIMYNQHHVLRQFLPGLNSHTYSLRPRRHSFVLAAKTDERNFIIVHRHLLNSAAQFYNVFVHCFYCVLCSPYVLSYVLANCIIKH